MQLSSFQNGGSRFTVTLSKRSTQKSVVHFIQDPLLCEKPRHRRSGGRIDYTECGGRGGMLQNTRDERGRGRPERPPTGRGVMCDYCEGNRKPAPPLFKV